MTGVHDEKLSGLKRVGVGAGLLGQSLSLGATAGMGYVGVSTNVWIAELAVGTALIGVGATWLVINDVEFDDKDQVLRTEERTQVGMAGFTLGAGLGAVLGAGAGLITQRYAPKNSNFVTHDVRVSVDATGLAISGRC
jgi:hypothetical protein